MPEPFAQAALYDITEITGADNLYQCTGAIRALEEELADAYRVGDCLLSAGGSTLCIQTMLYLARSRGSTIICGRIIHRSAVAAMGLLGLDPCWLPGRIASRREGIPGLALPPTPEDVEAAIAAHPDAGSVYITSPDYFGQLANLADIAEVCHRMGKALLVDNAHGAHLGCFRAALHPMSQGADFCCDSLHKNLPALTGAAVLHLADPSFYQEAKYAMSLFGSTSPSYLIMLSAENALQSITEAPGSYWELSGTVEEIRQEAGEMGYDVIKSFVRDPLRLALGFEGLDHTPESYGRFLRSRGVEPEYLDRNVCVFMLSPNNTPVEIDRLRSAIAGAAKGRVPIPEPRYPSTIRLPRQILSVEEAMRRREVALPAELCPGRVSSRVVSSCPPGIPMLVPGEEITSQTVKFLRGVGYDTIYVVR
jgi:arginine/lysine/ornithine decarboxylase